ncbi:D-aminoacyl-tRNA deacylase [Rubellicoccus peritrichatus]|uniref:D-aminoacyl-tRNA deacylase n=1 Tax=Rubellicoccus peritrichatus TaxID=3080537 RepID=A0AAQ3L7V0_9BACT|nr:D-aminoacyl-tRNA deacylase [Puniceicoccus sp. CR14]WOO41249.1 D-aminoacyl-tRNA deacylase [Puniceicoccus sp. CR14]
MRAVVQRVSKASVSVEDKVKGEIGPGLLLFLGISQDDTGDEIEWLAQKVASLRVFEDEDGKMNRSVMDIDGGVLVISQFTLYGHLKKGTRPSFNRAGPPEKAIPLYERFIGTLSAKLGKFVPSGEFGAMMVIDAVNHGPVTLIIDTTQKDF